MNILPGQYSAGRRGVVLENGTFLPLPQARDLTDGHLVHIGIRPEHAELAPAGQGFFDAKVDMTEEMGAARLCNLLFEDIPFCVMTEDRPNMAAGTPVGIRFAMDRAHVFDAVTGRRVKTEAVASRQAVAESVA